MDKHNSLRDSIQVATYNHRKMGNLFGPQDAESTVQVGTFDSNLVVVCSTRTDASGRAKVVHEIYSCTGFIDQPEGQDFPWRKLIGVIVDGEWESVATYESN